MTTQDHAKYKASQLKDHSCIRETSLWSGGCLPFSETSFLLKREIPLDYDTDVEVKFSGEPARGHTMGTPEGPPRLG